MMKKLLAGLLMTSILSCSLPAMADDGPKVLYYYVSQDAPAGGDGSIDKPFSSLIQAKNAMRLVKNKDDYDDVRIIIRGGKYEISDTITFTVEDSGGEKTPLIVSNYPGEEVIFSGGRDVDMSKALPVTDEKVRARIPEESRDKVMQVDLGAQGLTGLGILNQTYYAVYNTGTPPSLLWDGETVERSRWPNEDYALTGAILYAPNTWYTNESRLPPSDDPGVIFKVDAPRVAMWKDAPYALLFGYYGNDWSTYDLKIKDVQSNIVFTTTSPGFGISKGRPYYIRNLIEEIDMPGEWYVDRDTEILYIYPKTEITEDTNVCFTTLEKNMIELSYAKNVKITGIIFENSKAMAVQISNSTNCELAGCVIRNMAATGAGVGGGYKSGIRSCDIYNIGGTAISIGGGDKNTLEGACGNYVVNCHIHNWATVNRVYNGAIRIDGVGQYVAHNKIHNAPHLGIQNFGNNAIMEYNEIYDVCLETADSGAIYMGKNFAGHGAIVRHNYFHDLGNSMGGTFTVVGVYFDDMFSGGTIYGNLFVEVDNPILVGGGSSNKVENNLFINAPDGAKQSLDYDSRGSEDRWLTSIIDMELSVRQKPYNQGNWATMYPELMTLLDNDADMRFPHFAVVKNNVSYNHKIFDIHENVYTYGTVENNLHTVEDIGLVDEANGDYRLKEDSIIYKVLPEFQPLKAYDSGLYLDEYRLSLDKDILWDVQ